MFPAILLMLQAAAAQAPDIELNARVRARTVTIHKKGEARLTVSAGPDGASIVDVEAPKADGRKTLRDVEVNVRAEARIGDQQNAAENNPDQAETAQPQ